MKIKVKNGVATAFVNGEAIGQYEAELLDYRAANIPYYGCSCGEVPCRHRLAIYWGIMPSHKEKLKCVR